MNQTAPKNEKARLNLASVTPAPSPPEPEEMDTKTPIDISVIPFTQKDIAKWGAWVLHRMTEFWPHLTPLNYTGILYQHANSNGTQLLRARTAIIMAVVSRETLEPRPIVDIVFCFKHRPENQEEDKDVRLLFRRVEDWARGMGAIGIRVLHPERCDTNFSRTKEVLWGNEVKYLLKEVVK